MSHTLASDATNYLQATRLLAIDTPLGPDKALLISLEGEDSLSHCFLYYITIATEQPDASVQSLLGKPVTLWLANNDQELRRPIHGHVRRITGQGMSPRGVRLYKLEVVPRLWFLNCTSDCRIFQNRTIPDVIQEIFSDQGLTNFEFRIVRDEYPKVDYCVQYRETAFNFVSRLMEHLGLFYWHEHSADSHRLVIADRNAAAARCHPAQVGISPVSGPDELQTLEIDSTFCSGRWTLNDYDFESPTKLLRVDAPTTLGVPLMANHEMYDFPGKFSDHGAGRWLSRRRIEMEESQQVQVFGTGRAPGFDPGRRFTVKKTHNSPETIYLLTEVRHHATDPTFETGEGVASYSNDFVAIPIDRPFRPKLVTPKPFAHGVQTATVVGPAGENIHCDVFGRVRVQFHWDRRGQRNDRSSCWIRVVQSRAGSYYGNLTIPHVGHEVIVAFLEADPDRPMIVGAVPNALTMPPVELPYDKHKTIQRDHADNRIIMQGKPGEEHLSLVSPRRVNMFAARQGARPLSAGADPIGNPVVNTFSDSEDNPFPFDPFQDQTGLFEVWEGWYLLTHPGATQIKDSSGNVLADLNDPNVDQNQNLEGGVLKVTPPGPAPSTSANPAYKSGVSPGVALTADECDINSFTEGRNNALSLGNKNTWVWQDNNTWVHGNANTHVIHDTNSEVNGNTSSTVHGNTHSQVDGDSNSTINGGATSMVYAYSVSGVIGDRATFTLGANETLVYGPNLSINFILAVSLCLGVSISWADTSINKTAVKIAAIEAEISALTTRLETTGAHLTTAENNIQTTVTTLHDHGIEVHI